MPTYEYTCENCGYRFEKLQSITARAIRKCPKCSKPALKRLIGTGAGIIFKGSGFYATDYRSESYKKAAKSETPTKVSEKKETPAAPAKTETQKESPLTTRGDRQGKSKK
jgi:putative FmdB family regulatory protein